MVADSPEFDPSDFSGFVMFVSDDPGKLPKPTDAKGPDLRLSEYVWYLGNVVQGKKTFRTLTLRNVGTDALEISDIAPTCTCVTVEKATEIAPSRSLDIQVTFDSAGKIGYTEEQVIFHSNDPVSPIVKMTVVGTVLPPILPLPVRIVAFGNIKYGHTGEVAIPLPVKIIKATSTIPQVSIKQDEQMLLVALAPGLPIGEHKGELTIESEDYPPATIPVTVNIKGSVDIRPSMIFFHRNTEAKIAVSGSDHFSLENHLDFLTVSKKGKGVVARLKSGLRPGNYSGSVYLSSGDERVEIPVYAYLEK